MGRVERSQGQQYFNFAPPTIIPRGDGSIIVTPGKVLAMFDTDQAARSLDVSRSTIYRRLDEGCFPEAEKRGPRKILIPASDIDAYRQNSKVWKQG